MSDSPLILMTLRGRSASEERRDPTPLSFEWLPHTFAAAVVKAGGIPLFLSNECNTVDVPRALRRCDGLFLTGGEDVAPERFGERDTVGNLNIYPERDAVELAAIRAADELGMPILGVCRGIQVLNVARGGTIYQDLRQQYPRPPRDHSRGGTGHYVQTHVVKLTPDGRLRVLLQELECEVATSHHQAVRELGRGLVVVAESPEDGVIEAVEEPGERFVIGVQWHPEVRPGDTATVRLFSGFVDACRTFAAQRNNKSH